jgi:hypothetical protein
VHPFYTLENQGREEGAWYPFGIQAKLEQTCNFECDTGVFYMEGYSLIIRIPALSCFRLMPPSK